MSTAIGDATVQTDGPDEAIAASGAHDSLEGPSEDSPTGDADDSSGDADDSSESLSADSQTNAASTTPRRRWPSGTGRQWWRIAAFGLLPGLALLLACGAGYMKWQYDSARDAETAAKQSVATATESTVALLSYRPDTAAKTLNAASDLLTGTFRDSYGTLIRDVVIPGAQQKHVSAVATVPAAASVSATANHAVVLLFVNQSINVGADPPSSTASSVKVTLDKIGDKWLISDFTPV